MYEKFGKIEEEKQLIDIIIKLYRPNIFNDKQPKNILAEHEYIFNLDWTRHNQKISIERSIEQSFISGIDFQATGAGKTYIMFAKAYIYGYKYRKNVMIICERIDILRKMIFKKNKSGYDIDQDKKKQIEKYGDNRS